MMNETCHRGMVVLAGNSHPELAKAIVKHLDVRLGSCLVYHRTNRETMVEIHESVRGKNVYIVQTGTKQVNDSIMELLIMCNACKGASANKIIGVIPYMPYSQQTKMRRRGNISMKLLAHMLVKAGFDQIITVDLHSKESLGFFDCAVDNIRASPFLLQYIQEAIPDYHNAVIVARNPLAAKRASSYAERLRLAIAVIHGEAKDYDDDEMDNDGRASPPLDSPLSANNEDNVKSGEPDHGNNINLLGNCNGSRLNSPNGNNSRESTPTPDLSFAAPQSQRRSMRMGDEGEDMDKQREVEACNESALSSTKKVFSTPVQSPGRASSYQRRRGASMSSCVPTMDSSPTQGGTTTGSVSYLMGASGSSHLAATIGSRTMQIGVSLLPPLTPKERPPINVVGDVRGKIAIMVDNMINDVQSFVDAAQVLKERGARKIYALATHGLLSREAPRLIQASAIDEVVVTNTVTHDLQKMQCDKIKTVDIAILLAEAIRRIHNKESMSHLFRHVTLED